MALSPTVPPPAPLAGVTAPASSAGGRKRRRAARGGAAGVAPPSRPISRDAPALLLVLIAALLAPAFGQQQRDRGTQLFAHEFTLPEDNVARGLAYVGSGVKVGVEDWFSVTAANLARAFPAANVSYHSGALPATTSAFATPSIPKLVRPEADLVFVEYTVNDGWEDEPALPKSERAKSFERTLRTLLSLPRRPAVVMMHALPSNASRASLPFWASEEDAYGVLAQYYDIPSLSVRDAIWHEYIEAGNLLKKAQEAADARERERTGNATAVAGMVDPAVVISDPRLRQFSTWQFNQLDERHPTARGQRMMADLVVGLLQHEYIRTAVRGARRGKGAEAPAEEEDSGASGGGSTSSGAFAVHDARSALPPPMYPGNDAGAVALQCLLGEELASAAVKGLQKAGGGGAGGGGSDGGNNDDNTPPMWRLVNDGDARKPKWGLVADAPGSELVLELDTRVAGRGGEGAENAGKAATASSAAPGKREAVGDDARRPHDRRRTRALSGWLSFWANTRTAAAAARDAPRPRATSKQEGKEGDSKAAGEQQQQVQVPLDAELWIGVTRSWRGQGSARVACEGGGCRCDPFILRAHDAGRKVTQNYVERLPVSQSARCRVVVRLPKEGEKDPDGRGPDGGRRVKLVGVTVASSLPGAAEAAKAAGGGC